MQFVALFLFLLPCVTRHANMTDYVSLISPCLSLANMCCIDFLVFVLIFNYNFIFKYGYFITNTIAEENYNFLMYYCVANNHMSFSSKIWEWKLQTKALVFHQNIWKCSKTLTGCMHQERSWPQYVKGGLRTMSSPTSNILESEWHLNTHNGMGLSPGISLNSRGLLTLQ